MMHKAWSSIEEVPYCFSRSSVKFQGHTALKIIEFDPNWAFPDYNSSFNTVTPVWIHQWLWNAAKSLKYNRRGALFFSCDQAALWMVQSVRLSVRLSVCLSVRLSVCHTFLTMFPSSYHHEIFRSYYQWQKWRPCKRSRSKVKVTEVTTQLNRFRTVTPVWIHIWWWDDAYSLIMLRRGALLFFKVIRQISRSHGSKNRRIWPRLGVSGL